jgi:hypothetical protein
LASPIISTQKKTAIKKSYEEGMSLNGIKKKHKTDVETVKKMATEGNWQRPENYNDIQKQRKINDGKKRWNKQIEIEDDSIVISADKISLNPYDKMDSSPDDMLYIQNDSNIQKAIKESAELILDRHFEGNKSPREMYEELGWDIEKISQVTGKPRFLLWSWKKLYGWTRKNNNWRSNENVDATSDVTNVVNINNNVVASVDDSRRNKATPEQREYEQKVKDFKNWMGEKDLPFTPKNPLEPDAEEKAWLVTGDQHIPYHNKPILNQIIQDFLQKHKHIKFKGLVLNGDLMDGYHMNSYGRDDKHKDLKQELVEARIFLSYVSSLFDEIIVVDDNHIQGRQDRYREQQLDYQLSFTMRDINDMLVEGFPNVKRAKKIYANGEELGWFTKIGDDAIAGHYEVSASGPLGAAMKFSDWVDNWSDELGLGKINLIIEAHVHKGGEYIIPGSGRKIIEGGCVVSPAAIRYAMKPNAKGSKPPVLGATYVVQKNGKSVINECKFVKY